MLTEKMGAATIGCLRTQGRAPASATRASAGIASVIDQA